MKVSRTRIQIIVIETFILLLKTFILLLESFILVLETFKRITILGEAWVKKSHFYMAKVD